jgi:phosphoribosylanthranilate isomerase
MAQLVPQQERLTSLFARGSVVKICGIREPEHAAAAAAAGADLIGFIFAPARRQVTAAAARACIDAARSAEPERSVLAVGVFVDASLSEMKRIVEETGIDALQLHGDEPPEALQNLAVPAVKAFRPRPGTDAVRVAADINRYRWGASPPIGILVDGYTAEVSGGSGERADWRLARELSATFPILLGGGLDSENVGAAIREVRPLGVDVSSGVEIDGVKAAARIEEFILAARQAFQHSADRGRA